MARRTPHLQKLKHPTINASLFPFRYIPAELRRGAGAVMLPGSFEATQYPKDMTHRIIGLFQHRKGWTMPRSCSTVIVGVIGLLAAAGESALAGDDDSGLKPKVKIETSLGDVVVELNAEKAPISVLNFIQYAEEKHYEGTIFHRVMSNFMIQGGGYTPDLEEKKSGLRPGIKNEWQNGLKNEKGTIAMARLGNQPDSATAQFFINVVDNAMLDQARDGAAYAVFGKVVEGADVVEKIRNAETKNDPKYPGGKVVPVEPITIKSVTVVGKFDRAKAEVQAKAAESAAKEAEVKAKADREKELQDLFKKVETETGGKLVTTESGLKYVDMKVGEGESPKPTDTVEVHYTGWLVNGTKFDSSVDRGQPASFALNGVIKGWTEGVGSMKVGGKRKLIVPAELGYGKSGRPPKIPGDSTLVFDVELISIKK